MDVKKLTIEYDGTRYSGWQKQLNSRSIQGEIIKAADSLLKTKADVGGAGRTDAGVHALHQVAHLKIRETKTEFSNRQLQNGLNDLLPSSVNILKVENARDNFHARHDAVSRYYIYQISTRRNAFAKNYVWWVKDRLNIKMMQEACGLLIGKHNFYSFCETAPSQTSTIVAVETAQIFTSDSLILFRIGASHFLWKMVRRIVGTLVETGRGNLSVKDFQKLLETKSKETAKWTAPPSGLFLEKVLYEGDAPPTKPETAFQSF